MGVSEAMLSAVRCTDASDDFSHAPLHQRRHLGRIATRVPLKRDVAGDGVPDAVSKEFRNRHHRSISAGTKARLSPMPVSVMALAGGVARRAGAGLSDTA